MSNHNSEILIWYKITFFVSFMKIQGQKWKCKDKNENARTKRKMQGQKGKCKDDIKSYFLDRFEQIDQSKTKGSLYTQVLLSSVHLLALVEFVAEVYGQGYRYTLFSRLSLLFFAGPVKKTQIKSSAFLRKLQIFAHFWHLLSKHQNHEEDCANFCGLLRKAELYTWLSKEV